MDVFFLRIGNTIKNLLDWKHVEILFGIAGIYPILEHNPLFQGNAPANFASPTIWWHDAPVYIQDQ